MPDSIGEALKVFLEKHLVPTVISVGQQSLHYWYCQLIIG